MIGARFSGGYVDVAMVSAPRVLWKVVFVAVGSVAIGTLTWWGLDNLGLGILCALFAAGGLGNALSFSSVTSRKGNSFGGLPPGSELGGD